jgi:hypothetical protein
MTGTILSRWQNAEDGYPTDAYIDAVDKALAKAGVTVADGWTDGRHDYTFEIASPIPPGYGKFYVAWVVDEHSDPLNGGFRGHGWLWVGVDAEWDGERTVRDIDVDFLAEPNQVAASVAECLCQLRADGGDA